jgi:fermentation-respiration switch protein FrsA (DUF1100 family)
VAKGLRWTLFGLIGLAVIGYAAICGYLWRQQDAIVYPGGTVRIIPLSHLPAERLPGFQALVLSTPDGQRLNAWWRPPPAGRGVVIYLHGNQGTIGSPWRVDRLHDLAEAGLGVLALEYRGFGGSSGHPSETGLITDAETGYDFVHARAPNARIALFGESLGTGVAIALANRRPVAGVILDSPYASMLRLAELRYPWLPDRWLLRDPWDSQGRVAEIAAPLFIAHCDADRLVPLTEGQRLFAAARAPKEMVVLPRCGHVETWTAAVRTKALADFQTWTGLR